MVSLVPGQYFSRIVVCGGCCFWVCFENFIVDASIFVDYFVILTSY